MNIKSTIAAITLAATSLFAVPAEASIEDTYIQEGRVAGFNIIASVSPEWDTLIIPMGGYPGVVLVNCHTGDFRFNDHISRPSALAVANSWCN